MRMRKLFGLALAVTLTSALFAQYGDISDLKLNKPEDREDVKSTPAPKGAVVLFGRQEPR